jgi:serine/threonine protein kinase
VALKEIKSLKYDIEIENLSSLREKLSSHTRIVTFLAAVSLGHDKLFILSPLADMDLGDFIRKPQDPSFEISLRNLVNELANVADALKFLHSGLKGHMNQIFACCHMDLKPENILIFREEGHPVGRWCITDFGISTIKETNPPLHNSGNKLLEQPMTVGMVHEATKTCPKRGQGTYQAPEVNNPQVEKAVGRKSDVFSLGCVLTRITAFGLGRTELEDFDKDRCGTEGHGDFFYRQESDLSYVLNPAVDRLLAKLLNHQPLAIGTLESLDNEKLDGVVRQMLNPKPDERPNMENVCNTMKEILAPSPRNKVNAEHVATNQNHKPRRARKRQLTEIEKGKTHHTLSYDPC